MGCLRNVIESNHGDIFRHAEARFAQRSHGANRHDVTAHEERVGTAGQELLHRSITAGFCEITFHDQTGIRHHAPIAQRT